MVRKDRVDILSPLLGGVGNIRGFEKLSIKRTFFVRKVYLPMGTTFIQGGCKGDSVIRWLLP